MIKNTLILMAALLVAAEANSQCGVYLSADDYLNGKLTSEANSITIPSGRGPDDRIKCGGKSYLFTEIWGYKDELSEYRILYGEPKLIVCKGNIYAFSPYGPIKKKGKDEINFYRPVIGFGEIMITKDLRSPEVTSVTDYQDLWPYMDTALIKKVKEYFVKRTQENEGIMAIPEQIINYYNSLKPGYIESSYNVITVNVTKLK